MRVLLRNTESGFYYTARRKWLPDPEHAVDLVNVTKALRVSRQKRFRGTEVILAHESAGLKTPFAFRNGLRCEPGLGTGFAERVTRSCSSQFRSLRARS